MTTDTMGGVADERDTSAVDRLDREFEDQRIKDHAAVIAAKDAETEAERVAARAKADVERSAARAVLVKRAGLASLLLGAGIAIACFGASFLLTRPERVVFRDVPGPERVVTRDVPGPERIVFRDVPGPERVVTHDVPGPERVVTHDVPGPERIVFRDVPGPERVVTRDVVKEVVKEVPGPTVYVTKKEGQFIHQPEYQAATSKGRIVKSTDGFSVFFDNGTSFQPVDETLALDTDALVGDLGYCSPIDGKTDRFHCFAIHDDVTRMIPHIKRQVASATTDPASAPVPGSSPKEEAFIDQPEYKSAEYKGRLVADARGYITFDNGKSFLPRESGDRYVTAPYVGDYAFCNFVTGTASTYKCLAMHNGKLIDLETSLTKGRAS